ncbi:hypothetical protein C483_13118 [Natrialba hulunbeirensis JCM 10989]|uniref:Uncharacterized protein n=1 Tax=Natrialba hulunbeirensis JCM 10989 TaxID=1227493 RepID=L9ZSM2_9EURY|nr:hypothetical protein [Natrialba hulunbeirensis]ELY89470.1 hypothetical protein C483_13118 [Natrialba hulunbeirensis JCM 10989]
MRSTLSPRARQAVSATGGTLGAVSAASIIALGGWSLVLIAVIWFVAVSYSAVWLARTLGRESGQFNAEQAAQAQQARQEQEHREARSATHPENEKFG